MRRQIKPTNDLKNLETFEAYEHAVGRMERFVGAAPAVIAHDLHPDYLSTRYALGRPEPLKIAVQHHHAHVCAAMAEHGLEGPVIGVAYDGTGLGTDGTSWGGEVLVADYTRFARVATFRPVRLPGGDLAIRQVWRQAGASRRRVRGRPSAGPGSRCSAWCRPGNSRSCVPCSRAV